jgi:TolA-binding protein
VTAPSPHTRAAFRRALGLLACLAAPCFPAAPSAAAPAAIEHAHAAAPGSEPALRLARAQAAWRMDRPVEVVRELEHVDFSAPTAFEGADRAAFLLAQARLRLGDRAGFERLAAQVAAWPKPTEFTRALAGERALLAAAPSSGAALRDGGAKRLAADAEGAERFRAAADRLAAGDDPLGELGHVPDGSAYASAARDLAARVAAERGRSDGAVRDLREMLKNDSNYVARREVEALLADDALRRGDAREAFARWTALDARWTADRDALRALAARPRLDSLVAAWESDPARSGAAPVSPRRAAEGAAKLGASRADARTGAGDFASSFDRPALPGASALAGQPTVADWRTIATSDSLTGQAAAVAARATDDARLERERLAELTRYLGTGQDSLARERETIEARLARLSELHRSLDQLDARLRAVRDSASRRVVLRAAAIVAQCEANERWIAGLDHFWVNGASPMHVPSGHVGPDSVVTGERELARGVAALATRLAAEAPATIANSYTKAWRPGVLDRIARQDDEAGRSLAWARRLAGTLDSSLAEAGRAAHARALETRAAALDHRADSLLAFATRQRDAVARRTVQRTLAGIETEREAIDYGLASSAWAIAAGLDHAADGVAPDSNATHESPEATRWRAEAIASLQAFLARHPAAEGRADARYRLADLLEQDARASFRERMAEYVKHPGGAVPVLETSQAIALHRAILRDDPTFAHRDAVLFDLGSLLAERGDPEATRHFRELVNTTPDSPLAQESWLRLADDAFDQQHFAEAAPLYRCAVNGRDTTLRVIALYKLGWTEFHEDQFERAADAFGEVLDLYGAGRVDARIRLDDDAEVLLVHTLARAGGAPAFAAWFDRAGPRPYELRLLQALGQHLRKYSLFGPAIAADQLLLDRHPLAPEALESARRMDDTYARWNRPAERRVALLANAERFSPGSAWILERTARAADVAHSAPAEDSLRAAGDAFARAATLEVAEEHHRAARAGGGDDEWREAARLEERVLATWPADPMHRALHLQASEALAALGDVPGALAHADSVFQGRDTLAAAAALQRVAILDAWYERTRPSAKGATGSDSVAHAVLAAGDQMLDAFPADPNAAGVRWRQGQLAFAHGWFERAAETFGAFTEKHPSDPRAPRAATLRADAWVRAERFDRAREAYERAYALASRAGDDSLARRVQHAIPACAYRDAESRVAADSTDYSGHAARFENVALRWPAFEHADVAWYRSGLAYFHTHATADGARAMASLLERHPKSALARDAVRATAGAWEAAGDTAAAAQSWLEYASRFRADAQADDASLRAAGFFERAHEPARSDSLRLGWIRRHPGDAATAMALLEPVVSRALDSVSVARPVSRWLAVAAPKAGAKHGTPRTVVGDYLARATAHPDLASRVILARVRFLEGEEAAAACAKIALRQPLARSIGARKARLDLLLARYKACVETGEAEWAHAATFRIGEALVSFGDALEQSERPKELRGADREAYDEIIHRQSDGFYQRAEGVWGQLLEGQAAETDDAWLARARAALQPRMALRSQAPAHASAASGDGGERKQNP